MVDTGYDSLPAPTNLLILTITALNAWIPSMKKGGINSENNY